MEKTTSNTPRFYSRLNLPERKPSPAGSEWAEKCVIDVDSETGAKVLKIVGRENIYEKIQECLEQTKIVEYLFGKISATPEQRFKQQTYGQEGLLVKTYQSDIFNNWVNTASIDAINAKAKISTTSGEIGRAHV